jgi:hypothetical protein
VNLYSVEAEFVNSNFNYFSSKAGSEHIASISSQLNMAELLLASEYKYIFDFGSGIGTLIKLYLEMSSANILAFERNEWCRNEFLANVKSDRVKLIDQLNYLPRFDFITIDDEITIIEILRVLVNLDQNGTIFIEGWRNSTVAKISLCLFILLRPSSFIRCKNRTLDVQKFFNLDKSGSYFQVGPRNFLGAISSYFFRARETREVPELLQFSAQYFKIYKLLDFLKIGKKVRRFFKIPSKVNTKTWKRITPIE